MLGLEYPLTTVRTEITAIHATISTGFEALKTNAFFGADEVSTQHFELFVVETRKIVVVHSGIHSMTGGYDSI